jgi:hypothetical protein
MLGALKWPLTVTGAVLVFGLSSEGTLSLVSINASKFSKPIAASPDFNMPPVRQIGELDPVVVVPKSTAQDRGTTAIDDSETTPPIQPDLVTTSLLSTTRTEMASSGRIGSSAVNIRAATSKSSASLGVLAAGTPIRIGETSGSWVHVQHQDGTGCVYSTLY